jgi:hypothetical protein
VHFIATLSHCALIGQPVAVALPSQAAPTSRIGVQVPLVAIAGMVQNRPSWQPYGEVHAPPLPTRGWHVPVL